MAGHIITDRFQVAGSAKMLDIDPRQAKRVTKDLTTQMRKISHSVDQEL